MSAPFLMPNDVKIGKDTPNGFTLEVNGYEPIECSFEMKFERERKRSRFTGKLMKGFVTVCYPKYYVVVHWSNVEKYQTVSLDLAKAWIATKLNRHFEQAQHLRYKDD
jgi:hypothetical protein